MNYKQKYQKALEKARKLCEYPTTRPFVSDLKDLFPELANAEDVRKSLIEYISGWKEGYCRWNSDKRFCENAIAWLEKQGEQKPTDKEQTNKNLQDNDFRRMFEQKPTDETTTALKNPDAYRIGFADGEAHAKEQIEWGEEDEKWFNSIIHDIKVSCNTFAGKTVCEVYEKQANWLKSLKERIKQ